MKASSVVAALALVALWPCRSASAQSTPRPVEVAPVLANIRFNRFAPLRDILVATSERATPASWIDVGLGARLTYRFSRTIAVEWETDLYPSDTSVDRYVDERGGRKTQLVVGPLVGRRWRTWGLFGKIRPGLMAFRRLPAVVEREEGDDITVYGLTPTTSSVLDLGGVLEFYPSERLLLRVDVGDTIIWYRAVPRDLNHPYTGHELQINASVGFRIASR